jgi:actin-related protein
MARAGYAGEDTPRVMFPTSFGYIDVEQEEPAAAVTGEDVEMTEQGQDQPTPQSQLKTKRQYFIGDNKINKFRSNMEVKSPMKDGMGNIVDPELLDIWY